MRVQYRYSGGPGDVMVAFSFEFEAAACVGFRQKKQKQPPLEPIESKKNQLLTNWS